MDNNSLKELILKSKKYHKFEETIPYQIIYLSNKKLTNKEINYGLKVAKRIQKNKW